MKRFLQEYLDIFIYIICGIILVLGSYNIVFNVNQAKTLRRNIIVRDNDANYKEYKGNVLLIEEEMEKIDDITIKNKISYVVKLMEDGGVYQLFPYNSVSSMDLYNLNNYFVDTLINEGWTAYLKELVVEDNTLYTSYIKTLVSSYNYVNKELLDNSNYYYKVRDDDTRDILQEQYNSILNNYCSYSRIVLNVVRMLGDKDA